LKRVGGWKRVLVGLGLLGLIVSGYLAYLHLQKPLVVVDVEYRSRVDRGGNQEFKVVINSKNPIQSAALELNGTFHPALARPRLWKRHATVQGELQPLHNLTRRGGVNRVKLWLRIGRGTKLGTR
jgi:hypothetical protein